VSNGGNRFTGTFRKEEPWQIPAAAAVPRETEPQLGRFSVDVRSITPGLATGAPGGAAFGIAALRLQHVAFQTGGGVAQHILGQVLAFDDLE